jgi:hypothetical protein
MKEEWKDIIQLDGDYQISTLGRVRRSQIRDRRGNTYIGKILKSELTPKGYERISIHRHHERTRFRVHRLVAEAFIPNPDNKPFINHVNGIKTDNRVENLEWCTTAENNSHNDTLIIRSFLHELDPDKMYSVKDLQASLSSNVFQ